MVSVLQITLPSVRAGCSGILLNRSLNGVTGAFTCGCLMNGLYEAQAQWRARNPKKVKAIARAYRKRRNIIRKRWMAENWDYMRVCCKAHMAVHSAVRDGTLKKPKVCEQCKRGGVIQGHHEDYSKPLSVNWLCVGCHNKKPKKRLKAK